MVLSSINLRILICQDLACPIAETVTNNEYVERRLKMVDRPKERRDNRQKNDGQNNNGRVQECEDTTVRSRITKIQGEKSKLEIPATSDKSLSHHLP